MSLQHIELQFYSYLLLTQYIYWKYLSNESKLIYRFNDVVLVVVVVCVFVPLEWLSVPNIVHLFLFCFVLLLLCCVVLFIQMMMMMMMMIMMRDTLKHGHALNRNLFHFNQWVRDDPHHMGSNVYNLHFGQPLFCSLYLSISLFLDYFSTYLNIDWGRTFPLVKVQWGKHK